MDKIIIPPKSKEQLAEQKWLEQNYPMTRDNPCLNMSDQEFLDYIRMRREAFDYEAARERDRAQRDAYFKEKSPAKD